MEESWYLKTAEETLLALYATRDGLSDEEAKKRLLTHGLNRLEEAKDGALWKILGRQFLNPLILVLIVAALVKLFTVNILEGSVLTFTLLCMAFVGFIQEIRAERAIDALKNLTAHKSKVKRNGKLINILSQYLVPGDIIFLEMGDKIPADARLIEGKNLKINESMFNGESAPVEKIPQPLVGERPLMDRGNMVYSGSLVSSGKGIAVVVGTGMNTELGKIAESLKQITPEKTPLEKNVHSIGRWMLICILFSILVFIAVSFYKGLSVTDIFFLSVAAAVSAIPEGLPIVFTITLARGVHIMAKKNAIIRKLVAVETLGSTTIICSDKTGTLTLNQMKVTTLSSSEKIIPFRDYEERIFSKILEIGMLCNDASLSKEGGISEIIGDCTEGALLEAATHVGMDQDSMLSQNPRIGEIPFSSETLYMATLHVIDHSRMVYVKGAPEKILSMSGFVLTSQGEIPLDKAMAAHLETMIEQMAKDALRTIAVAYCVIKNPLGPLTEEVFRGKLVFSGIIGIIDPPREEAIHAIATCKEAGIKVVMITGDNPLTAAAIAKEVGIPITGVLTGKDLHSMSDDEFREKVKTTSIFARIEPAQKLSIVKALQSQKHIVAMTGDGINDAPALETADIGIAMGITGTDVAKESADMVLADDQFDTIVAAVEEGRAIFNRLRSVTAFLLTTSFGELFGLILSVSFLGMAPLTPLQILWINLITGSLIALPLGFEPKMGNETKVPPRSPQSTLIYEGMVYRIIFFALQLGLGSFLIFHYALHTASLAKARTMVLCCLVTFEWLVALKMRSEEIPLRKLGLFSNMPLILAIGIALVLQLLILYVPFFQDLFHVLPLTPYEWLIALIPGIIIFSLETLRKEFFPKLFSKGRWS